MSSLDGSTDVTNIPQPVIKWLFTVIQASYNDSRTTFHDSVAALSKFKQFRPRTRVFTAQNGIPELLLCIYGCFTNILSVPLLIWVPRTYPLEHPLIFLDLELLGNTKPSIGEYVTPNGQISLPIFNNWSPDRNNILQVIQQASEICQYNCFVRPTGTELYKGTELSPLLAPIPSIPPELPRKPPKVSETNGWSGSSSNLNEPSEFRPKLPPREDNPTVSSKSPLIPPKPPVSAIHVDLLDTEIVSGEDPLHLKMLLQLQTKLNELNSENAQILQQNFENRRTSIESAINQMKRMLEYESSMLKNVSESIKHSKSSLDNEITILIKQSENLLAYEEKHGQNPDVLSLIITENIVINQLYELLAKDCAISDTIHALSRLLSSNSLKLETFVKKTRELAREQFHTRIHIQKLVHVIESNE